MQELREELNSKAAQFAELASRAASVPPIKQRRLPVARPIQITAVCNYNSDSVSEEITDFQHFDAYFATYVALLVGIEPYVGYGFHFYWNKALGREFLET